MGFLRNILALVGLMAVAAMIWMGPSLYKYKTAFDGFDPKAFSTYKKMADQLVETGNAAAATVWKAKVAEGITFEEVDESIKTNRHCQLNIRGVGEFTPWRSSRCNEGQALA